MEDFVTFEIAKKLKEKGFRKDCIAKVNFDNTITFNHVFDNDIRTVLKCHNKLNPYIDAPTITQVLKWLREEKKIHIGIDISDDGWFFDISSFYKEDTGVYETELHYLASNLTPDYESYEQTALAGIEYVIDNLI